MISSVLQELHLSFLMDYFIEKYQGICRVEKAEIEDKENNISCPNITLFSLAL